MQDEAPTTVRQAQHAIPEVLPSVIRLGGRGLGHPEPFAPPDGLQAQRQMAHGGVQPGVGALHGGEVLVERQGRLLGDVLRILGAQVETGYADPQGESPRPGVKLPERFRVAGFGPVQKLIRKSNSVHISYYTTRSRPAGSLDSLAQ